MSGQPPPIQGLPLLDVTVEMAAFRRALLAVTVHASKNADRPSVNRVRCYIAPDLLTVTATDGYTAGIAVAPVIAAAGVAAADVGHLDLSLSDVAKVLAVFRCAKRKDGEDLELLLRIQVACEIHPATTAGEEDTTALYVNLQDVSGLVAGETLELPLLPWDDHAPHVPRMVAGNLAAPIGSLDSFGITADLIARFSMAAKTYGLGLLMSVTAGDQPMLVVRCGAHFVGVVRPQTYSDDTKAEQKAWLEDWATRLPPPPAAEASDDK